MTLNGVMAVTMRYFTEFGKHTFQHITAASSCGGIYAGVYCILYHVYDVVVKKVHFRYLISWWVSCLHMASQRFIFSVPCMHSLKLPVNCIWPTEAFCSKTSRRHVIIRLVNAKQRINALWRVFRKACGQISLAWIWCWPSTIWLKSKPHIHVIVCYN